MGENKRERENESPKNSIGTPGLSLARRKIHLISVIPVT
jgi:hypothetical protein